MLKNCITANEARALSKGAGCISLNTQPYITRMFDDIRKYAKIGKTKMWIDLIEYTFHFNQSLTHPAYIKLMENMEACAERSGFAHKRILQRGEYLLEISWAEN